MDQSQGFVSSTQGFDFNAEETGLLPLFPEWCDPVSSTPAPAADPGEASPVVCVSSDDDVLPTDSSAHDQTLTFIDFMQNM